MMKLLILCFGLYLVFTVEYNKVVGRNLTAENAYKQPEAAKINALLHDIISTRNKENIVLISDVASLIDFGFLAEFYPITFL